MVQEEMIIKIGQGTSEDCVVTMLLDNWSLMEGGRKREHNIDGNDYTNYFTSIQL